MVSAADAKVLVVGAGGIGCELLKNLVLSGFRHIKVIDLDTIDFSNLNRQFLFRKEHVGMSKALVAKESVLEFCPDAKIDALHDTVIKSEYNSEFFGGFDIVLNALDNRAARNHVNRLCLAANVPLVESGTQGYLGQVTPILKGISECYECQLKSGEKTYAGCTIRNTPSEPIHCIVWAKHLFNQLFGLSDADEQVSPDTTDPELGGKVDFEGIKGNDGGDGNVTRVSTRDWAAECEYDAEKVFNKLFSEDIVYLKNMKDLWEKRRAPEAILYPKSLIESCERVEDGNQDQHVWNLAECAVAFRDSVKTLKKRLDALSANDYLTWDKDDQDSLDFVTACANIRMECFGIKTLSQFDIKSMAGNIIPAIATTNAITAGLIVIQALRILRNEKDKCRSVYLRQFVHPDSHELLAASRMELPNPKCYVCSEKNEIFVVANTKVSTMKSFRDKLLKAKLNMAEPDATLDGQIVISSEEGETDELEEKTMESLGMIHCARLSCDDFLQNFSVMVNIVHSEEPMKDGEEFLVKGELPRPKEDAGDQAEAESSKTEEDDDDFHIIDEEDDLVVLEDESETQTNGTNGPPTKRRKT